ncbi:MAG: multidrug efflux SMR transporter [Planctomycetota bacterium]
MKHWLFLTAAILCEVIATSSLKASHGFTRPVPTVVVVLGYAAAFYLLSLTLNALPIGVAYAIWSGVGIVLLAGVGWVAYGQKLDAGAIAGIALIVVGVVILNAFSKSVAH